MCLKRSRYGSSFGKTILVCLFAFITSNSDRNLFCNKLYNPTNTSCAELEWLTPSEPCTAIRKRWEPSVLVFILLWRVQISRHVTTVTHHVTTAACQWHSPRQPKYSPVYNMTCHEWRTTCQQSLTDVTHRVDQLMQPRLDSVSITKRLTDCLQLSPGLYFPYLRLYSPCGPWPLFQFLNLYTVGRTPWTGIGPSQGRYLYTGHQHRVNAHRHPCLEWDTNPHPSVRASEDGLCLGQRGHCDRPHYMYVIINSSKNTGHHKLGI
jgi:hypothetical protein